MSREWAIRACQYCRQLALPRSGIVVVLALLAAAIYLRVGRFPIDQQYEVFSINGRPLPLFLLRDGRVIAKYRPALKVILLPNGETTARGWVACNVWSGPVYGLRLGMFIVGRAYSTALGCAPAALEIGEDFHAAFARVVRWRREGPELILEGYGAEIRLRPSATPPSSQSYPD